jgi:hypothetical protein
MVIAVEYRHRVFPAKSEDIWFYNRNMKGTSPPGLSISMAGEAVEVGFRMMYLDLIIDSRWTSGPHFDLLVPKVSAAVNALCGLLPNIGRAGVAERRIYEGIAKSRVLYGALIWAGDLVASRRNILPLRKLHRVTAIGIVRGISNDILCVGDCSGDISSLRVRGIDA